jgi:hypothetical protein
MAKLDDARIMAMVNTQLEVLAALDGGDTIRVTYPGDQQPRGGGEAISEPLWWCRLVAIDIRPRPRVRPAAAASTPADEPHHADITVTINVGVNREATIASPTSLLQAAALVRTHLGEETLRHADSTHQIDFRRAEFTQDAEVDEQRGIQTGVMMVTGTVSRQSGTTLATFG